MEQKETVMTPEKERKNKIRRRIIIFGGLGVLVLVIVLAIFIFQTPKTVTFSTGVGTNIEAAVIDKDGHITKPADPTRTGWDFGGWYINPNHFWEEDIDPINIDEYTFNESITLYAKWTLHRYQVTYELNGGRWSDSVRPNVPYEYVTKHNNPEDYSWSYDFPTTVGGVPQFDLDRANLPISLLDPIRDGYTFDGWYDNPNFTGNRLETLNNVTPTDITLYARWAD